MTGGSQRTVRSSRMVHYMTTKYMYVGLPVSWFVCYCSEFGVNLNVNYVEG